MLRDGKLRRQPPGLAGGHGSLQIFGHVDATSGGQGVSADIAYQGSEYQANSSCTVTFMYQKLKNQSAAAQRLRDMFA